MPCTSEKAAMDAAWNQFTSEAANATIYVGGGLALMGAGGTAMGLAAAGEVGTLGLATPAAGPVFAGGMGLAGAGFGSYLNGLSHSFSAGQNLALYHQAKAAYEDCLASQIQFQPVSLDEIVVE